MSNATRKIKKEIKKPDELYTTLIGSIITSVGMISGKTYESNKELFNNLKKDKKILKPYNTVKELCDYIFSIHGRDTVRDLFENGICLCYDEPSLRQPLVCFVNEQEVDTEDGTAVVPVLLPLDPKGDLYGVMQAFMTGSPNVFIEQVYYDDPEEELAATYNELNGDQ